MLLAPLFLFPFLLLLLLLICCGCSALHQDKRGRVPHHTMAPFVDASNVTTANCGQCAGHCQNGKKCVCADGYITWPENAAVDCAYKQKGRPVAFLLSFFLGEFTGAGEWYLGNTDMAKTQLFLCTRGLPVVIGMACLAKYVCGTAAAAAAGKSVVDILFCVWMLAIAVLWLIVWICTITGATTDGNGAPLSDPRHLRPFYYYHYYYYY